MSSQYENLLLKLITVLELIQQSEIAPTPQTRQALVQATNEYKESLRQAKEAANALPGGELSLEEQDEVIDMLERLRDRKRQQLLEFSANVESISTAVDHVMLEVDSTASTPAGL
ncbi:uncharacterized protein LAESUDRAFT_648182 [Laetiporus sulphureus 93-53]|uniref:Mediator of RNA polymerase II transcription subunit 9 n=1 Tax=Laetiporus sulphureus 93-53 TaxID=1314785 RepID=A0A165FJW2_9APHY|nr:uncharacterized protein LAESUDRAFT_648182 [Laetiporus sulphureus 93-53]KZT09082.1 hypothetical protein LAESUDRAFT_648182 [Laetiporus sulphureus 93-53]